MVEQSGESRTTARATFVSAREEAASPYQGVRGWLLFLCVLWTFWSPLATLASLGNNYARVSKYFAVVPGLRTVTTIQNVLCLGLTVLGIFTGLGLWTVGRSAVRNAKIFLVVWLVSSFVFGSLPFYAGYPPESNPRLLANGVRTIAASLVVISLCYTYLVRSKRVRNTYSAELGGGDSGEPSTR